MSEDLGAGGQERNDGRLIDVTPLRMLAANNEIQLIPEKPVMGITYGVDQENDGS